MSPLVTMYQFVWTNKFGKDIFSIKCVIKKIGLVPIDGNILLRNFIGQTVSYFQEKEWVIIFKWKWSRQSGDHPSIVLIWGRTITSYSDELPTIFFITQYMIRIIGNQIASASLPLLEVFSGSEFYCLKNYKLLLI